MRESSVFQHLLETRGQEQFERGFQEGLRQVAEQAARQANIKYVLSVLEVRFDVRAVQALRPALESIQDLQRLEELHREVVGAESFESFACVLGENLDR